MPTKLPSASRTMRPRPLGSSLVAGAQKAGRRATASNSASSLRIESLCIIGESPATTSTGPSWPAKCSRGTHHGVPGAALFGLQREVDVSPRGQRLAHVVGPIADDDDRPLDAGRGQRVEHVVDHRPPADRHQHLGQLRLHSGALAGCHDDRKRSTQGDATSWSAGGKQPSSQVSRPAFQWAGWRFRRRACRAQRLTRALTAQGGILQ